jgi:hypothetical protein
LGSADAQNNLVTSLFTLIYTAVFAFGQQVLENKKMANNGKESTVNRSLGGSTYPG